MIPGLVCLEFLTKTKLVPAKSMRESYDSVLRLVNRHFPETRGKTIEIKADVVRLDTVITAEAWSYFVDSLDAVAVQSYTIEIVPKQEPLPPVVPCLPIFSHAQATKRDALHLRVTYAGEEVTLKSLPSTRFRKIQSAAVDKLGLGRVEDWYMVYEGQRMGLDETPEQKDLEDGDELDLFRLQVGGKPVIYLRSPTELDATVELSLVSEWSFSALYPVVPIAKTKSPRLHQSAQWHVRTATDGTMQDKRSGAQVSYLFWEAETNPPSGEISPPPSPVLGACDAFGPANAADAFKHSTSVALAIQDVPLYLDAALLELGLDTEARTSFITYWLPSFLHHPHILLSFVPQSSYESAAPLFISPTPDVITRVFMIFRRLDGQDIHLWEGKARRPAGMWRDVINVPEKKRQLDTSIFRVLEWGGMEVKP